MFFWQAAKDFDSVWIWFYKDVAPMVLPDNLESHSTIMIQINTGALKLDDYALVIHPDLSLTEFNAGDIPVLQSRFNEITGYTNHFFEGKINGMDAYFLIQFQYDH
jgi:hypothetical protein